MSEENTKTLNKFTLKTDKCIWKCEVNDTGVWDCVGETINHPESNDMTFNIQIRQADASFVFQQLEQIDRSLL